MTKSRAIILFLTSILSLGCASCGPADLEVKDSSPVEPSLITWDECGYAEGDHMCDFTLKDQNGDDFNLYNNVGKPIILDYSTMWCGYCQVAAREVTEVQQRYSEHDLIYVTVLVEDSSGSSASVQNCEDWASVFGIIDAPVLAGSRDLVDLDGISGVPITGWPTFIFLQKDLKISSYMRGFSSAGLESGIQTIITE